MPSSTKCLYKEGGSADDANDSILVTRTSDNATVRQEVNPLARLRFDYRSCHCIRNKSGLGKSLYRCLVQ